MDQYEIIGIDHETTPSDDGPAPGSSPTRPWLVVVPVVAVIALVVALTRGGPDPVVDQAQPTSTTAAPVRTSTTAESTEDADLVASFDGQLLLIGRPEREMTVRQIGSEEETAIGIVGEPLLLVDEWLIYRDDVGINALNLADAASTPIAIQATDADFQLVDANEDTLFIHHPQADVDDAWVIDAYRIGLWADPVRSETVDPFGIVSIRSQSGSGVYELTPDGYRWRGDGELIGASRTIAVVFECEPIELICATVVRDRTTWAEQARFDGVDAERGQLFLSPSGLTAMGIEWSTGEGKLIDLATGDSITMQSDVVGFSIVEKVLGQSDQAIIVAFSTTAIGLVDIADGRAMRIPGSDGIVVPESLPLADRYTNG